MGEDSTFGSSLSDFGSEFLSSALDGLGFGSGQQAAKTVGSLIRPAPVSATPPPPAAPAVKGTSLKNIGSDPTKLAVLALGVLVVGYLVMRA